MSDLLNSLNASATGVGLYGAFSLDANGHLTFQGSPPSNAELSVVADNTQRGAGGPSISQLFGLGAIERSARAGRFQVNPLLDAIAENVGLLADGKDNTFANRLHRTSEPEKPAEEAPKEGSNGG